MNKFFFLHIVLLFTLLFPSFGYQVAAQQFTIVIDPGHGGRDSGARGNSINEKDINLAVALKLGKMISDNHSDVKVVYTRSTDKFVELDERAEIANRNKADLFMSIHANAVKTGTVRGTETYTLGLARTDENLEVAKRENAAILLEDDYLQKYEGFDPNSTESYIIFEFMQNKYMEQSVSLASEIQKCFVSAKRSDRGVRQAGFLVLRKTSMPSVLVELGYITNADEARYMKSASGQHELTTALYSAFVKHKREHDRKKGALTNVANVSPGVKVVSASTETEQKLVEAKSTVTKVKVGVTVYKIQILTADKKLPANSKRFKGYKDIECYMENGVYKYTYGESTDFKAIQKQYRTVAKDFKDAFVVTFRDGKRVNK